MVEHTIVTFSWLQGNLYPGFGVISFQDDSLPHTDMSFKLEICDLPPQMDIYMGYILLLGKVEYSYSSFVSGLDDLPIPP